jgi:hypothetical protein
MYSTRLYCLVAGRTAGPRSNPLPHRCAPSPPHCKAVVGARRTSTTAGGGARPSSRGPPPSPFAVCQERIPTYSVGITRSCPPQPACGRSPDTLARWGEARPVSYPEQAPGLLDCAVVSAIAVYIHVTAADTPRMTKRQTLRRHVTHHPGLGHQTDCSRPSRPKKPTS